MKPEKSSRKKGILKKEKIWVGDPTEKCGGNKVENSNQRGLRAKKNNRQVACLDLVHAVPLDEGPDEVVVNLEATGHLGWVANERSFFGGTP